MYDYAAVSLTKEQVEAIAYLARLQISDEDVPLFVKDLSRIIDFVDQLKAAEVGDVEPMAHPLDMAQRLRADEITEEVDRDAFQANAPRVEAGLYLVPKVIE